MVSAGFVNTTDIDTTASQNNIISTSTEIVSTSTIKTKTNSGVASKVKVYFSDAPIMQKIAYCESRNRQYSKDGSTLRGVVNSRDVGIFQVNEKYHLSDSKKMGIDIHTVDGNLEYARHLYESQGTQPWSSSRPCWGNYEKLAINK
ncbi:hypothetical protein H7X65_00850 [Candidatus Parcubacteria bacterium]|nr:hypothetical protein [Candidatus Parcubacteria bacterium]